MKRFLLMACMALIYSRINAQRFYLEPMLLSNITQYESRVTTPEYTFMNGNIGYKLGSPNWQLNRSINYGINAGIRGHLFHFEGGFFTDQATSMTHITLYKGVEERKLEYFQKLGTYRINTNFGVNILRFGSNKNPKSMHHELWIRVGMDAVFGREDPFVVHEKKESFELSGTNFEITESYYLNIYNHLKMINFGIKYRLNSGLKNLLCINLYYCYRDNSIGGGLDSSFRIQQNSQTSIDVINYKSAWGINGLYFSISKEFSFNNSAGK